MLLYQSGKLNSNIKLFTTIARNFVAPAQARILKTKKEAEAAANVEWSEAKSFKSLPGPTKFQLLRSFLPGGRFHGKSLVDLNIQLRKDYGDILILPGSFGKRDVIFTYNPKDYEKIFRTEGVHPIRRSLDILSYYSKVLRKDIFKHAGGLVAEQGGPGWAHIRSMANPVMMNPKVVILYAPKMNKVSDEFIARIRNIRDSSTKEVPANFEGDIKHWVFETVCLIALDTELGMINNSAANSKATAVIEHMSEFLALLFQLDIQPSVWKLVATPKYKQCIATLNKMTELSTFYIDAAIERFEREKANGTVKPEEEKSVLERLYNIDRSVALVMAMDILQGGLDTTASAFVACLLSLAKNPEKQAILRAEIRQVLPQLNEAMTGDKLKHLPYLRACIKEGMRIHPVSLGNFRTTGQDIVLSGYRVPKGTDVAMSVQFLMHDEKYYGRPNEYLPERWLRSEDVKTEAADGGCPLNRNVPFVFLPFGFGPRFCIGKRIVEMELEIILAKLVRNFEIRFDYSTKNMWKTHMINVPAKPLKFKFIDVNE